MGKIKRIRVKHRRYITEDHAAPGSLHIPEDALKPKIFVHSYNEQEYVHEELVGTEQIDAHLQKYAHLTHWLDIRGLADAGLLQYIQHKFRIHTLILEDIVNFRQRPKLDESEGYLFAISRLLYVNEELEIENEQMSFLLTEQVLISFQENYTDTTAAINPRLESGKGNIRSGGTSYMMYALMDIIVDNYFTLIYKLGEELETLEDLLYRRPAKSVMYDTQSIKRALYVVRRAVWPERDKINDLIRSDSPLIADETKTFLRDTYDHCMQIMDLVESYKDITTSLIDMNLSFISNRMNEIMKVLTVISSLFIPLTFIAGVYGMNFAYKDPDTGKVLRDNMPELYAEHGYAYTLAVMALIALVQLIYFYRKGWLSNR